MECPFCDAEKLKPRVFHEDANWLAFLAAPAHTRGHTILAAAVRDVRCPQRPDKETLSGVSTALAEVIKALMQHFGPEDVLFASLRGSLRHIHLHLVPLWAEEETAWRRWRGGDAFYERGHLMEYMGFLEERGDRRAIAERLEKGWSEDDQRDHIIQGEDFQSDVSRLRSITGCDCA